MEGFEHVVKVAMESENFVVTSNVKFPVLRQTRKKQHDEYQRSGYEIDLVGARGDRLLLASVKSYFGSRGVSKQGFVGLADETKKIHFFNHTLFNDEIVREGVISAACEKYGYEREQVELRFYAGKFANLAAKEEITEHLANIVAGSGSVRVYDLDMILDQLITTAESKTYVDDPVVMLLKALKHSGRL